MEILFPRNISCIFCNMPISQDNDLSICKNCFKQLKYLGEICIRCGRFGKGSSLCTQCASETYHFDQVYAVLEYNDFMHSSIYGYKYGHKGFLAEYFGEIIKRFIQKNALTYDYITGVPISKKRNAQRGYNQSYLMGELIDKEKFIELFYRKKETRFLSKLTKVQRMIELKDAFSLNESAIETLIKERYGSKNEASNEMENKNEKGKIKILIIDDILTTGSTASEMAKLLKNHVADIHISLITLCNARK